MNQWSTVDDAVGDATPASSAIEFSLPVQNKLQSVAKPGQSARSTFVWQPISHHRQYQSSWRAGNGGTGVRIEQSL